MWLLVTQLHTYQLRKFCMLLFTQWLTFFSISTESLLSPITFALQLIIIIPYSIQFSSISTISTFLVGHKFIDIAHILIPFRIFLVILTEIYLWISFPIFFNGNSSIMMIWLIDDPSAFLFQTVYNEFLLFNILQCMVELLWELIDLGS